MLIVLGMSAIFGAIKGLAWQIASLASITVSYVVACRYRGQVAEMIDAQPPWNMFLAMLILYVGTGFVIWVGFRLMSSAIDKIRLKTFDRHLGAIFGLGKGVIFCLLITMFAMTLLGPKQQSAICQSRSGYYISAFLDKANLVLPQEVHSTIGEYLAKLESQLKQGQQNPPVDDGSGMFNTPNLSNLSNGLQQLLPHQLNDLLPQSNPVGWPNTSNQPSNPTPNNSTPGGFPGLGGFGSGGASGFAPGSGQPPANFGPNNQPQNGPSIQNGFGGSQPTNPGFNPGFGSGASNNGAGSSGFGSNTGTGLRQSGGNGSSSNGNNSAELPGGIFPR